MSNYFEEEDFTAKNSSKTMRRIFSLMKPYTFWVFGFVLTISIVSGLDSYFTFLSKRIVDEAIGQSDLEKLIEIITQYGLLAIFQAAAVFGFIYLAGVLGERIRYDLREMMFKHLQTLSLSYFNKTPVGWIMSRVTSDSDRVAELVTWGLLDVTWGVMNIVTALYFMFRINWQIALIVLAIIPILVVVATEFRKRIIKQFRLVRKINSKITGAFNENITGVRVIKALRRERGNLKEFGGLTTEMFNSGYRAAWLSALFLPTVQILSSIALGAVVWLGGIQVELGFITIGGIQAFISYINFMMWPIQDLARVYAEMQQSIASAERIFSMLDADPKIINLPEAYDPGTIRGEIEFKDVIFAYEDDEPVLKNFSLKVNQGETIALVGPTGGGKTTIVNLLGRFFEPTSGEISIDGKNYKAYTQESIQSRIGIVLQTPHLFSGTILENIRYGKLDATDEEVFEASKLAGAHSFISSLDKEYKEAVGEGGNLLSVGQKQLISLARAILADPEIFIMDEATSSVDTLTEALIQKGMERMMEGRTSFVIAHRLSTIKQADRILVIEDGQIAELGSHNELLKQKGHYYRLYTQQFRRERAEKLDPFIAAEVSAD